MFQHRLHALRATNSRARSARDRRTARRGRLSPAKSFGWASQTRAFSRIPATFAALPPAPHRPAWPRRQGRTAADRRPSGSCRPLARPAAPPSAAIAVIQIEKSSACFENSSVRSSTGERSQSRPNFGSPVAKEAVAFPGPGPDQVQDAPLGERILDQIDGHGSQAPRPIEPVVDEPHRLLGRDLLEEEAQDAKQVRLEPRDGLRRRCAISSSTRAVLLGFFHNPTACRGGEAIHADSRRRERGFPACSFPPARVVGPIAIGQEVNPLVRRADPAPRRVRQLRERTGPSTRMSVRASSVSDVRRPCRGLPRACSR